MAESKNKRKVYTGGKVLEGLNGVRARLAMYIGSTGCLNGHAPRALTQMMQETVSNSADEYLAGFGDVIEITLNKDGSATVLDHGRGIPKGPGKTFENIINMMTKTHASGKFDDASYADVGTAGMNGIGMKAVNSGSSRLEVEACSLCTKLNKNGEVVPAGGYETYFIAFKQADVLETKIIKSKLDEANTYTKITFWPDGGPISEDNPAPVLESTEWVVSDLIPRFEATAFLMDGLTITLNDEREGHEFSQTWKYEHGIEDYLKQRLESADTIDAMKSPIVIRSNTMIGNDEYEVRAAFTWTENIGSDIVSFANGVPTPEGGPHVDGFQSALTDVFREYAGSLKTKGKKSNRLDTDDVLDGISAVFEVRIPSAKTSFEGQTKEKLGTVEAKPAVQQVIKEFMPKWFFDNEKTAKALIGKMQDAQASKAAATKARKEARAARKSESGSSRLVVSSKLKAASSNNPEECELFIVEGDSASRIGKLPFQAVFPLRGKILNAYRVDLSKALANVEISTIVSVLGAGVGPTFNVDDMDYHKVIITTDADSDGGHIRMLLIGLFAKFFPGLIESGRLYIAKPPLYKATRYVKGQRELKMYYTEDEMSAARENLNGWEISRYKGLGEMNLDESRASIVDPKTRHLIRVTKEDSAKAAHMLKTMLGKDAEIRKDWIFENIEF